VKLKGVIRRFRRDCAAFGLWNTLQAFGNQGDPTRDRRQTAAGNIPHRGRTDLCGSSVDLTAGFLDRETLRRLSAHAKYDLSPGFLDAALSKGDECYAIMDGVRLAAYAGTRGRRPR